MQVQKCVQDMYETVKSFEGDVGLQKSVTLCHGTCRFRGVLETLKARGEPAKDDQSIAAQLMRIKVGMQMLDFLDFRISCS